MRVLHACGGEHMGMRLDPRVDEPAEQSRAEGRCGAGAYVAVTRPMQLLHQRQQPCAIPRCPV